MRKTHLLWLMNFLIISALLLAACGGGPVNNEAAGNTLNGGANNADTGENANESGDSDATDDGDMMAMEPLKFGMILVGPKNDHGWSQAHFEGGQYIVDNLEGSEMILFELLNPADKPEATLEGVVDEMVAQGASLIFTTSDEFEEDTLGAAEKYPDVVFINISGVDALTGEAPANLGNIMGRMEDMKAIAGCAAALTSQTGQIGYVGPLINFETRRLTASAYLGADYCYQNYRGMAAGDLQFTVTWIGFWFNIPGVTRDPSEVTTNFIYTGVEVVMFGIDTTEGMYLAGQLADGGDAFLSLPYD
jgi:simple sugar transport system substrate-binding protein